MLDFSVHFATEASLVVPFCVNRYCGLVLVNLFLLMVWQRWHQEQPSLPLVHMIPRDSSSWSGKQGLEETELGHDDTTSSSSKTIE